MLPWLLNAGYLLALLLLSPWLIYRAFRTGRYRRGLFAKLVGLSKLSTQYSVLSTRRVWFHAVSVGEVHLLRQVIGAFRKRFPEHDCVVSSTTDTGLDEATRCFPDLCVISFPLDFSWAVRRTLRAVNPVLIVLAESELWPNFLLAVKRRGIPVAVVNARMSPRSFARYRRLGFLSRWLLRKLDLIAVQTEEYATNFRALGVDAGRVHVTGSVKFDGAKGDRHNPQSTALRQLFDVHDDDLVWVAGSTQAPEEEIVLRTYQKLRRDLPRLRLFIVPRQRDRFDEVARLLETSGETFVRRSSLAPSASAGRGPALALGASIILVDTIGELGALWGLADIAFVGGSLDGRRGGQNMIEPAAYGAAVLFGPHVWNFRDPAARLLECGGAVQVGDELQMERSLRDLLHDRPRREEMGAAAMAFVQSQQGATEKTLDLLGELVTNAAAELAA
jgi:3-deoxy-D-manno-octulosonic-acid transferase